jgi:hypothetical protein
MIEVRFTGARSDLLFESLPADCSSPPINNEFRMKIPFSKTAAQRFQPELHKCKAAFIKK